MRGFYDILDSVETGGGVLHFDVDWDRGRVAAISDERDALSLFALDRDTLRLGSRFGDSLSPAEGQGATNVILHPCEDVAVTAGWDRPLRLWSCDPVRLIHEFGDPRPTAPAMNRHGFWGASFSACGRYVDTHNLGLECGQRFNWATAEPVANRWGHDGPFTRHPAGDLLALAIGAEASVVFFGICDGPTVKWLPVAINLWVPCKLAFGAGTLAAAGGVSRIQVIAYDFPTLRARFAVKLDAVDEDTAGVFVVSQALAFSPGGRFLYVPGADGEIVAMDAADGRELHRWRAHDDMVTHLVHHPCAGRLMSGGLDGRIALSVTPVDVPRAGAVEEIQEFLRVYPPMTDDPDRMPQDAVTYLDTPIP